MQTGLLVNVILPLALFLIMFGMGMTLVVGDFKRIVKQPKAFAIGISAQMLVLPLLSLLIVSVFSLEPLIAVGLMILSFCPGGTFSNMFSLLAKGDVALSITLTAVVSMLAPFSIPFLTNLSMAYLLGEGSDFTLPLLETILKLVAITVIPTLLGMLLNRWKPDLCVKLGTAVKIFSSLFLFLIIAGIVKNNWANMPAFIQQVGIPALGLNVLALLVGFALASLMQLNRPQSVTIAYEVGIQNGTTALLVTSTILQNNMMSIAPTIYSLIMFVTGAIFGVLLHFLFANNETAATTIEHA